MIRDTIEGLLVGLVLTFASYLVGQNFGWWDFNAAYAASPLWLGVEVVGVLFNYACVYLVARQKQMNWPLGIIASVLLGFLLLHSNLKASMTLQWIYFVPIQFIGWYNWQFGGENKTELKVAAPKLTFNEYVLMAIAAIASWYAVVQVYTYWQSSFTPYDVGILVLSIVAQYLCNQKKPISWVAWAAVNVLSIYVFYNAEPQLYLLAVQYVLFLANTIYGYTLWMISRQKDQTPVHFGR